MNAITLSYEPGLYNKILILYASRKLCKHHRQFFILEIHNVLYIFGLK